MDTTVVVSSHVGWLLLGRFNTTSLLFVGGKKLSMKRSLGLESKLRANQTKFVDLLVVTFRATHEATGLQRFKFSQG